MKEGKKIGLSLSGGGYRATIYHLGTLKKLREMNILDKVDVMSTISGGSITGAYFGLHNKNFDEFEKGMIKIVKQDVINKVLVSKRFLIIAFFLLALFASIVYLLFTKYAWLSTAILIISIYLLIKYQYKIFPVSRIISSLYSKLFFENKLLGDLCEFPVIAINATNIETGRQFTFSRNKMSDSAYEFPLDKSAPVRFKHQEFPLGLAAASSTCVPFAFTPIYIDKVYYQNQSDYERIRPCLIDGGVYDNQGVHKLTQKNSSYECDVIIVSDAGNMMPRFSSFNNVLQLLIRTSDIFMNRIKNYQMIQHVYENYRFNKKQIAYQSLGWDLESCVDGFIDNLKKGAVLEDVVKAHKINEEDISGNRWDKIWSELESKIGYKSILKNQPTQSEILIARSVTTNLKTLSDPEINALIKQAECITELQVKLYCPQLID
jgi:NTE family protein